jgi:DNA-binding CsgD family transcriptional regulator
MRHIFLLIGVSDAMIGSSSLILIWLLWRRERERGLLPYLGAMASLQAMAGCFTVNFYLRTFMAFPLEDALLVQSPALAAALVASSLSCAAFLWLLSGSELGRPARGLGLAALAGLWAAGAFVPGPLSPGPVPMGGIVLCLSLSVSGLLSFSRGKRQNSGLFGPLSRILPIYALATVAGTSLEALGIMRFFIGESLTTAPIFHAAWSIVNIFVFARHLSLPPRARDLPAAPGGPDPAAFARERGLSPREAQIALAIRDGLANKAIARRAGLASKTVDNYVYRLYRKLGINSRFELMRLMDPAATPVSGSDPEG